MVKAGPIRDGERYANNRLRAGKDGVGVMKKWCKKLRNNRWFRVIGFTAAILLVSPACLVVKYLRFVSDGSYEEKLKSLWEGEAK